MDLAELWSIAVKFPTEDTAYPIAARRIVRAATELENTGPPAPWQGEGVRTMLTRRVAGLILSVLRLAHLGGISLEGIQGEIRRIHAAQRPSEGGVEAVRRPTTEDVSSPTGSIPSDEAYRKAAQAGWIEENQHVDLRPNGPGQLVWTADRVGWIKSVAVRTNAAWSPEISQVSLNGTALSLRAPFFCGPTSGVSFEKELVKPGCVVCISFQFFEGVSVDGVVLLDVLNPYQQAQTASQ